MLLDCSGHWFQVQGGLQLTGSGGCLPLLLLPPPPHLCQVPVAPLHTQGPVLSQSSRLMLCSLPAPRLDCKLQGSRERV